MTSKQRANLRSLAGDEDAIFQIGKDNISDNLIKSVNEALEARELIKISVLKTSDLNAEQAADNLARQTRAEVVSSIGNKFIIYRRSHSKTVKHIEF